jgi:FixJ family two-component response regulator
MLNAHPSGLTRTIHVVDCDHAQRASLAMRISGGGAHAEIYENLDELISEKPTNGAVLISFPEGGVQDLNRQMALAGIYLPIIVFADRPRAADIVRAAHDGVADFLEAGFSSEELIAAYDYSLRFIERNSAALLTRQRAEEQVSNLSDRERQVLAFLLEGHSNKSMGKELNLSPRTVEDYRLNALRKLGVASTSAAIRIGLEAGLRPASRMPEVGVRVTALS